jgi:hypothetical protein
MSWTTKLPANRRSQVRIGDAIVTIDVPRSGEIRLRVEAPAGVRLQRIPDEAPARRYHRGGPDLEPLAPLPPAPPERCLACQCVVVPDCRFCAGTQVVTDDIPF